MLGPCVSCGDKISYNMIFIAIKGSQLRSLVAMLKWSRVWTWNILMWMISDIDTNCLLQYMHGF